MSTNTNPPRQQAARLTGRRRSSILRTSLDQLQPGGRRRSSTIRKYARNIENFNRNRATNAVRERNDVGVPFPSRMRTRSMARADEEDDPTQRQQTEVRRRWQPSIVIGSPLWLDGEDPSKIEMADRKVAQTRLWAEHYQGVAGFAEMHQEAVRERAHLDEKDEANTKPRYVSHHPTTRRKAMGMTTDLASDHQSPPFRLLQSTNEFVCCKIFWGIANLVLKERTLKQQKRATSPGTSLTPSHTP